jgi:predicted nucleic acid-binding protein
MAGSVPVRVVAVDACVLINLIHVNRLDILGSLTGWEFVVPEQVAEEISEPGQARILYEAFREGYIRKEHSTDPAELGVYAELRQVMGRGEAACLAMAQTRNWMVACDERGRFLRECRLRLNNERILNTPGILLLAIRHSVLDIDEADRLKAIMEHSRFKMRFKSFRDAVQKLMRPRSTDRA